MASFQTVQFNITGPTYESRSRPVSSQLTVNMYQQFTDKASDNFVLHSFPGQVFKSEVDEQTDRNVHRMAEVLYRVVDDSLYRVNSIFEHFFIGKVAGGDRCIFADDGENLVIVADKVYVYNSFTNVFSVNANVNLVDVLSVTFINNQFLYTTAKLTFVSGVGDPFDVTGDNAVGAESSPDNLIRDYVFNQTIYRLGKRTVEYWYNSGVGTPPIDRMEGRMYTVGCAAIHSVNNTDNAIYWLGDDNSIYRTSGGPPEKISDDGLSNTLEKMSKVSDAYGHTFTLQGQDFYMITFPTGGKTYVVNEALGKQGWFNLASTNLNTAYSGTSVINVYEKNIVINKGKVLELSLDEYTQDSDVMLRRRITANLDSSAFGLPKGKRIKMSRVKFIMEAGVGLMTGQGTNPRIMIEPSFDGGRSFVGQDWVEIGRLGQTTLQPEWDNIDSFYEIMLRITISDPVPLTIFSATIDVKEAGR